jgi:HPt (histidine-containing phosphotransfer) domain-containing protein
MSDSRLRNSPYDSIDADDSDYRDLLGLFLEVLPKEKAELEKAFADRRWADVSRKAHQLKGTGGAFGFPAMSEKAETLEAACQSDDLSEISSAVDELLSAIGRILSS